MPKQKELQNVQELIDIMAILRSENGCQWDRQQSPESLKKHILEEAYELLEAIDSGNPQEICDELGDLLLQVVFQAQIFSEAKLFNLADIAQSISAKLKRRHPHIFSNAPHTGHEQRWEEIKRQERSERGQSNSLTERIPKNLPALKRATKLAKKCPPTAPLMALSQAQENLNGLESLLANIDSSESLLADKLSKALFEICKLSAAINLDPEDLLRTKTTQLISEIDSGKDVY